MILIFINYVWLYKMKKKKSIRICTKMWNAFSLDDGIWVIFFLLLYTSNIVQISLQVLQNT